MKGFAILLALALATAGVQGAYVYRHQFQYVLVDNSTAGRAAAVAAWKGFAASAPPAGKPTYMQCGADLGIGKTLYSPVPGVVSAVQADMGCEFQFTSEDGLRAFSAATAANPIFKALIKDSVTSVGRLQYLVDRCYTPPAGTTVYRHSFEYTFNATNGTLPAYDQLSAARLVWAKAVSLSPVKVLSSAFENDLGIGAQLYPGSKPNKHFAGTLDFASQADLTAFWKWVFPQKWLRDFLVLPTSTTRIQYTATF